LGSTVEGLQCHKTAVGVYSRGTAVPQDCCWGLPLTERHPVYLAMKSKMIGQTDIRALFVGDKVDGKLRVEYVERCDGYLDAVFSWAIARLNVTFA